MAKTVKVTLHGMPGEGATVREAKANAGKAIEEALFASYIPILIRAGGLVGIVFRTIGGWQHKVLDVDTPSGSLIGFTMYPAGTTEVQACQGCARHIAQLNGSLDGLARWLPAHIQEDVQREFRWQASYRAARASGVDDNAARAVADRGRG